MKKLLTVVGGFLAGVGSAFAEGGANNIAAPDWSAADAVVTTAKTALEGFVSTNAPLIGSVVIGLMIFTVIFIAAKLLRRGAKTA